MPLSRPGTSFDFFMTCLTQIMIYIHTTRIWWERFLPLKRVHNISNNFSVTLYDIFSWNVAVDFCGSSAGGLTGASDPLLSPFVAPFIPFCSGYPLGAAACCCSSFPPCENVNTWKDFCVSCTNLGGVSSRGGVKRTSCKIYEQWTYWKLVLQGNDNQNEFSKFMTVQQKGILETKLFQMFS